MRKLDLATQVEQALALALRYEQPERRIHQLALGFDSYKASPSLTSTSSRSILVLMGLIIHLIIHTYIHTNSTDPSLGLTRNGEAGKAVVEVLSATAIMRDQMAEVFCGQPNPTHLQ